MPELTNVKKFDIITAHTIPEKNKYEQLCKTKSDIWKRTKRDFDFIKMKDPDGYFEEYIRTRLKDFGFNKIKSDTGTVGVGYGGNNFRIGGWQVDACGECDGVFVLIDCATTKKKYRNITQKAHEWRSKCFDIAKKLKHVYGNKYYDVKYLVWTNFPAANVIRGIYPKDDKYLKYYERLFEILGDSIKYFILRELDVIQMKIPEGHEDDFKAPAFRLEYGNKQIYCFIVDAEILRKIAYVSRLESKEKLAYQRMLDEKKLEKIGIFLNMGGMFYNNIIIGFESEPKFIKETGEIKTKLFTNLEFGTLELPKAYCSAWVIDGQHRLYGFTRIKLLKIQQKLLNVIAIYNPEDTREREEAEVFYVINNTQTKIKPDLLWDLLGRIRPKTLGGLISNIVKKLNFEEPFKGKIYIPSISGVEKEGDIPISYFCTDLKNLRLIGDINKTDYKLNRRNDDIKNPINLLKRYFGVLQTLFKNNNNVLKFIFTHDGVSIMLEIMKGILVDFDNNLPNDSMLKPLLGRTKDNINQNFTKIKREAKSAENRKRISQILLKKILGLEKYNNVVNLRKREKKHERERGGIDYGI